MFATDDALDHIAFGIEHEEVRKAVNVVAFGDGSILTFAHVHVEGHKVFVEIVGKLLVGEYVNVHAMAGNSPIGVAVEEDGFLLCFGACQGFVKRAHIVYFDVGLYFVAIHAGFYLSRGRKRGKTSQCSGTSQE